MSIRAINMPRHKVWLDGQECGENTSADIRAQQDFDRHPFTGELLPGKCSTTAIVRMEALDIGGPFEQKLLASMNNIVTVTLAHQRGDSVVIARSLRIVRYTDSGSRNMLYVEIEFSNGEPLRIVALDKYLDSIGTAPLAGEAKGKKMNKATDAQEALACVIPEKETADEMTAIIKDILKTDISDKDRLAEDLCLAMWTSAYFPSLNSTRRMLLDLRDRARDGRYMLNAEPIIRC